MHAVREWSKRWRKLKCGQKKITSRDQRPSYEASVVALRHFIQPEGLFSVLKTDLYRPHMLREINPVHSPFTQVTQIHFNITLPPTIRLSKRSVTFSFLSTSLHVFISPTWLPHGPRTENTVLVHFYVITN